MNTPILSHFSASIPVHHQIDHDGRVKRIPSSTPSDESRAEQLRALAVTMHHDPEHATSAWLASRLEEIGASLDDFDDAYASYLGDASNFVAPDDFDADDDDINFERTVTHAWRAEVRAAARTDHWLREALARDPEFDWAAVAKLLGTSEEVLRRRAGAPIDGKLPRVGVSRDGLPPLAAAEALGIGKSTLYRWIEEGRLSVVKVNGRSRVVTDGNGKPIVRDV